jgi:transglutaminase-like putative cysteine protease
MRYTVYHLTHFRYDAPVSESVMEVRMQPRTESVQRCLRFELATTPRARVFAYQDPEGNVVHHFDVPARHRELTVVAESVVEFVSDIAIPDHGDAAMWTLLDERGTRERFFEFLEPSYFARPTEALTAFGRELGLSRELDPLSLLRRLKHQVYDSFEYAPQSTRVDSPIDEALAARRGVCQDFAHVMIGALRMHGLAARYVSGYLLTTPPPGHASEPSAGPPQAGERPLGGQRSREAAERGGPHLLGADASHAWVAVWCPGIHQGADGDWLELDPTNDLLPDTAHVRLAVGRDYGDVTPLRGVIRGGGEHTLDVRVHAREHGREHGAEVARSV